MEVGLEIVLKGEAATRTQAPAKQLPGDLYGTEGSRQAPYGKGSFLAANDSTSAEPGGFGQGAGGVSVGVWAFVAERD